MLPSPIEKHRKIVTDGIKSDCYISVVIPVRNEAESIENTLRSFLNQVDLKNKLLDRNLFEIIVLANNCTDNSAAVIKSFQAENPELTVHLAETHLPRGKSNIGYVRRWLMNEAYLRLSENKTRSGVMMTTDGDTTVAADWIAANLKEINDGADAVGGRIIISEPELLKMDAYCRAIHLKDEEYRLLMAEIEALIDELPFDNAHRHHQHFNGSFAVTTEAYRNAGGIPPVKFLEDCAFFDALQRIDARVRHSPNVKVYTSARHIGRSEVGLSFQLNEWKKLGTGGASFMVEPAAAIIERFKLRGELRKLRHRAAAGEIITKEEIAPLTRRLFVKPKYLLKRLHSQSTFGAFYESIMQTQHYDGRWARSFPAVALEVALNDLRAAAGEYKPQSFSQTSMR